MFDAIGYAKDYANKLGIDIHQEYNASEAAKLCRVGINALRAAKKNGEIEYLEIGETRYRFLGADLIKWKLQKRRIKSENTTSPETGKENGAELGTTNKPSSESLQAYALGVLKKQSAH